MSTQAQSFSESTSHFPWFVPPQGPFRSPLAQRVTGQMEPNSSRTHSPHKLHFSSKLICRLMYPKNRVSVPGATCLDVLSRTDLVPAPQESSRNASAVSSSHFFGRMVLFMSNSWQV